MVRRYPASMQITKFEHSCILLEQSARRLYLDPGKFTTPLTECGSVDGVVITHEHDDHFVVEQLARIAKQSPNVQVLTTARVADLIDAAELEDIGTVHIAAPGETVQLGAFSITVFGGTHAEIHSSIPRIDNIGVVVNGTFAYAGDAYDPIPAGFDIQLLAVPAYGPWMRMADSIDYLLSVRPQAAFAVHEMLLSRPGKELANARFQAAAESYGGTYHALAPGDSVSISRN